jgi:hypothetical protein
MTAAVGREQADHNAMAAAAPDPDAFDQAVDGARAEGEAMAPRVHHQRSATGV